MEMSLLLEIDQDKKMSELLLFFFLLTGVSPFVHLRPAKTARQSTMISPITLMTICMVEGHEEYQTR